MYFYRLNVYIYLWNFFVTMRVACTSNKVPVSKSIEVATRTKLFFIYL